MQIAAGFFELSSLFCRQSCSHWPRQSIALSHSRFRHKYDYLLHWPKGLFCNSFVRYAYLQPRCMRHRDNLLKHESLNQQCLYQIPFARSHIKNLLLHQCHSGVNRADPVFRPVAAAHPHSVCHIVFLRIGVQVAQSQGEIKCQCLVQPQLVAAGDAAA